MDNSKRIMGDGNASDTGRKTGNGEKGGMESLKEEDASSGRKNIGNLKEEAARNGAEDMRVDKN
jgi:hypothetical protein